MSDGPKVFDGQKLYEVDADASTSRYENDSGLKPVPPVEDGDGSIFVSIVSYRDGERCGDTIQSLFENAADPSKIVVGLVEHNAPQDAFCMEKYCEKYGVKDIKRQEVRADVIKVMVQTEERKKCPHYDQVRRLAVHHIDAKGPMYARSLTRKILGNEEFCLQIDAHTEFAPQWDQNAKTDWKKTNNEFAILSTIPAKKANKAKYYDNNNETDNPLFGTVPRQCSIQFQPNGFPDYNAPADWSYAKDLTEPLLSYGWSAAFSFAKCHLEESAPYDPFAQFAMPIEQFSRYARFWTRGYDTYTPSQNIVFHDYEIQPNGHGNNEWFKRMRDRFRQEALKRVKTILQLPGEGDPNETVQANLGLYGLGKRRSLQQLQEFTHLDFAAKKSTFGKDGKCVHSKWVPYDATASSPMDNLFDKPDNLDPQPEYPLRTNLVFYEQSSQAVPQFHLDLQNGIVERADVPGAGNAAAAAQPLQVVEPVSNLPSGGVLFILWVFGLLVWCVIFMNPNDPIMMKGSGGGIVAAALKKAKKKASTKDV